MATKNKKDLVNGLQANITTNVTRDNTAVRVKVPFSDTFNSVSVNITVAQLQAEDDSAEPSLANIIDPGLTGVFAYDATDVTTPDDNGSFCIVTSTNKRYKRVIRNTIDARWYGQPNYFFNNISDANFSVKAATRFVGLEITILYQGNLTTFWYIGGTGDGNLVIKIKEPQIWDFTIGDGGAFTPVDGATDAINPALLNGTVMVFWVSGRKTRFVLSPNVLGIADIYGQFDSANSKMTIKNGTYNDQSDYSIMYK